VSEPRVWLAGPEAAADVSRLMIAFRNWWKRDTPPDDVFAHGIERLLRDENTDFLLGSVDGGAPAGVCALRYRYGVWLDALDCLLEDLYVEDAARGRGLGEALVHSAVERARERGCRRIELDVNDANAPASALYERLGFSSYVEELGGHNRFMRLHL
jgi:ribosomal protein S18 acetylase RimI-like enzyme